MHGNIYVIDFIIIIIHIYIVHYSHCALILLAESTACCLIFVTITISVMVSNLDIVRQQVPCYLSEFNTFKCYFCHVLVMCSFNTWMKLSAGQLHFLQNLKPLFIPFLNLLHGEESLIHVLHNLPSELVRRIMMKFPKPSVVGKKTGTSLLSLDVDKMDNRLKYDREMEIGEPTS